MQQHCRCCYSNSDFQAPCSPAVDKSTSTAHMNQTTCKMQHRDIKQASKGDIIDRLISKRPDWRRAVVCKARNHQATSTESWYITSKNIRSGRLCNMQSERYNRPSPSDIGFSKSGKQKMMVPSSGISKVRTHWRHTRDNDSKHKSSIPKREQRKKKTSSSVFFHTVNAVFFLIARMTWGRITRLSFWSGSLDYGTKVDSDPFRRRATQPTWRILSCSLFCSRKRSDWHASLSP